MASLNKVFLMGNLTFDPEVRYIPSGAAVCELRLAVNRKFTTASGESREEVCFVDVVVWGKQGENVQRYLTKGSPVFIEGRLQMDQWEDKETGQKRTKHRVVAEHVQFLSSGQRGGGDGYQDGGQDYGGGDESPRGGGRREEQYSRGGGGGNRGGYEQGPQPAPRGEAAPRQDYRAPAPPRQQQAPPPPPPPPDEVFDVGDETEDDIPF